MKNILINIVWIILGITLNVLNVEVFWSGMGTTFLVIGVINLLRAYRINKNEAYKERIEIELNDERNRYIRAKAWGWAGYLFVMIAAVCSVLFRIFCLETLSIAAGFAVLVVILLFWISYFVLQRKY